MFIGLLFFVDIPKKDYIFECFSSSIFHVYEHFDTTFVHMYIYMH